VDTDIRYLELVRKDLVDAATDEVVRRRQRSHGPRGPRWHRLVAVAAAAVVSAGLVGWFATNGLVGDEAGEAFSASGETGATGATGEQAPTLVPGGAGHNSTLDDESAGLGQEPPIDNLSRVIRSGRLSLVIPADSFEDRFAQAVELASANGGFVETSVTRRRAGTLTVRVPAANFDETLAGLRALGDVTVQRISGQDVTAEYVDLQARLRIEKSRREVLLRLMDQAVSIEQTIRVQNALDDTQLRIEQLQGNIRLLDDRVSLATVEVSLREEGVEVVQDVESASLPNAFERSVAGFVGVIAAVVIGIGYLIPLALIGLVVWFVVSRVRRRHSA